MTQTEKQKMMLTAPVEGLICRMAVPTIISMLITALYNMADTYFVGKLGSNAATGAVGVALPLMAIIQATGFFFGHGSGNSISRHLGRLRLCGSNWRGAYNMRPRPVAHRTSRAAPRLDGDDTAICQRIHAVYTFCRTVYDSGARAQ